MATPILATKLYIPQRRPASVPRARLITRLNAGLARKLTLVAAPAGFGKTTLISEWLAGRREPVAWLSLDERDSDPIHFLLYLTGAVRTFAPEVGAAAMRMLQSPQPPPVDTILTALLNDLSAIPDQAILALDDYHAVANPAVDTALAFLLDHLPPHIHMVIATRAEPDLPLARWRARDQLTELRLGDLRFTRAEATEFLNRVMGLNLAAADIATLAARTEGWIAGLQLAAISLRNQPDATGFIQAFSGAHQFVLDYLAEEVLHRQPAHIQAFLLRTAILDRMCGPLAEAVALVAPGSGQTTLEYLEQANLFIVPLDDERRWYRYHHLFADLLRRRLRQRAADPADASWDMDALHSRASAWYEANGLDVEAFHHAAAAHDIERAERLFDGKGISLHSRGVVTAILDWFASLPAATLDARPSLRVKYAALLLVSGHTTGVEEKLRAAEIALHGATLDAATRDLTGYIAAARATLALTRYDPATMLTQSQRALEYLSPDRRSLRANAYWTLGFAYTYQGERVAARQALTEAIALSRSCGDTFTTILATTGLGIIQEADTQLQQAALTYQNILELAGDQPLQIIYEAHLGLARLSYEWNDLAAAEMYASQSLRLARQYERVIDRFIVCEVFLARLKLARGDVAGAATGLAQAEQEARQRNFTLRLPEVATTQILVWLRQGKVAAAARAATGYDLPLSRARVALAQGDAAGALATLEAWRQFVQNKDWAHEYLEALIFQAVALRAHGDADAALRTLGDALALAEPEGYIRSFIDEGAAMAQLVAEAQARGVAPDYCATLLAAFAAELERQTDAAPLIEPLSAREIEVLRLIAHGLANDAIGARLSLAVSSVKGHNQRIFGKLQVRNRTEAVARARELGLL